MKSVELLDNGYRWFIKNSEYVKYLMQNKYIYSC